MPIHDWSRVPSGLFHDFHQTCWSKIVDYQATWEATPEDYREAIESGLMPQSDADE